MEKSIVNSSSPPVSSSDDANFSQSSATTISENSEVIFARTLHGRLAKVSRDHDLFQKHLQTFSSNWSRSLTRRTTLRRQPTVRFQDKRSKSDSFSSTKKQDDNQTQSSTRKRTHSAISLDDPDSNHDSPKAKKSRLFRRTTIHNPSGYATQTATLRRALSLRSCVETNPDYAPITATAPAPTSSRIAGSFAIPSVSVQDFETPSTSSSWIPTAPCSPEPEHQNPTTQLKRASLYRDPRAQAFHNHRDSPPSAVSRNLAHSNKISVKKPPHARVIPFDVPIIAPPHDYVGIPLSSPDVEAIVQAKLRLRRFREREKCMMEADFAMLNAQVQKPVVTSTPPSPRSLAEELFAAGFIVEDYRYEEGSPLSPDKVVDVDQLAEEEGRATSQISLDGGLALQHGVGYRMIQWILKVIPQSASTSIASSRTNSSVSESSTSTSDSTVSSSESSAPFSSIGETLKTRTGREIVGLFDLRDQLLTSPETRFHAAYLFMRFFHLLFGIRSRKKDHSGHSQELGDTASSELFSLVAEGSALVTWDVAVACLALSVKLHRDFLPPLFPIYSHWYEMIAPHEMYYGDLESAQREVLFSLSYNLGSTPQAILDDLWNAIPSLQELLDFEEGWTLVLQETWTILFEAVTEHEIMDFPLSVVTAAAIMEALLVVLVNRYQAQSPWYQRFDSNRNKRSNKKSSRMKRINSITAKIHSTLDILAEGKSEYSGYSTSSDEEEEDGRSSKGYDFQDEGEHEATTIERRHVRERVRKAKIESEGVMLDIQEALGIADDQMEACREWIVSFVHHNDNE